MRQIDTINRLSDKQLKTREFIISVFRKEARAGKSTLEKIMKIYADKNNKEIVNKYGDKIISSFLAIYNFKDYNDYISIMDMLQNAPYFDTKLTFYSQFNSIITKKLFDSETVKTEWIIERMRTLVSFFEINNTISFIYTREKENILDFLSKTIDHMDGYSQDLIVFEAIIRHGMNKKIKGLDQIFKRIFDTGKLIEIKSIEVRYSDIKDKSIKSVIGQYLYLVTKNEDYLPDEVQNIFLF